MRVKIFVILGCWGFNYWIGIVKMGIDDGRFGGMFVVDLNIKVYGIDNIFVVDVFIFFGMIIVNLFVVIVIVLEYVVIKIFMFFFV